MKATKLRFWIPVVIQIAILSSIAGYKYYTVASGKVVYLHIVPVDPRSLFSGDYLNLNYEISNIDLEKVPNNCYYDVEERSVVFVKLKKGEKFWNPVYVSSEFPERESVGADEVVIEGRLRHVSDRNLRISYGIETYYVPEGKGREIERLDQNQVLAAEVYVDGLGNALIKQLFVNDQPVMFR